MEGRAKQSFMTSKTPPGIEKFENVLTARYILREADCQSERLAITKSQKKKSYR